MKKDDNLLNKFIETLKKKIGEESFSLWFSQLKFAVNNNNFIIKIPTLFYKKQILNRFEKEVYSCIKNVFNKELNLEFEIEPLDLFNQPEEEKQIKKEKKQTKQLKIFGNYQELNPKFTFETFIVGDSNQFAHAAALAVAKEPAKKYNPLFIYGGVGLGKTHLMQAIGHYVMKYLKELSLFYITCENFTNEYIESLTKKNTLSFREKYRNFDVLLIDDIQFLAGKEQLQEEFFHTFNTLFTAQKQIVITCDKPPKELKMEERLKTRFVSGLLADIQPPKIETRIAILKKLVDNNKIPIPDDVINYIATNIKSNIRDLEGALTKLIAFSSVMKVDITYELAQKVLKDIIEENGNNSNYTKIDINEIQKVVSKFFNISISDLKSSKRTKNISFARHLAMYLARTLTDNSLQQIGEEFGGRDHSTVINAYAKIEKKIASNTKILEIIKKIKEQLGC